MAYRFRFFCFSLFGSFLSALLATPAWPETTEAPTEPVHLDTVLLSPQRIPGLFIDASHYPGNVTVITARDIAASQTTTVQEVLARAEGVTLSDAQGFGLNSDSTVNLRGIANSSRTNALVLVDGVRQNRLTGDEVHWTSIPVEQIERIEIIRGGGGTIYGEGALAGVINIQTKQSAKKPLESEEEIELGSFGWQRYSVAARGRSGPLEYGTSYHRRLVDGYREYSSSRATTVTAHGGIELLSGARASLNVLHSEDTTAFPGGLTPAEAEYRREQAVQSRVGIFDNSTDQVGLDFVVGPYHGLSWLISTFWRNQSADSVRSRLFTLTPSRGLSARSSYAWTGQTLTNVLINGIELNDDKASTGTRGGTRTDESNRQGYGAYIEDTVTFFDRVSLLVGFRYDRSRFEEDIIAFDSTSFMDVNYVGTLHFEGKAPKVGLSYTVIPELATIFTSYSRPFKAPNVDDFASRSPEFHGNVSLQPQQADTYEIGLRLRPRPVALNVTWFYTRTQDEILFVQGTPANNFIFQNLNFDTRRVGVESSVRMELPHPHLRSYATYTFVDAEFRKGDFAGNTLPGTPEHLLNAGVGISPISSLWIDLDWQLVRDFFRFNDFTNILPGDNYAVLNLTMSYEPPHRFGRTELPKTRVYFKIQNITNEEYTAFQSSNGHTLATGAGENPMPPTTFLGGVNVQF